MPPLLTPEHRAKLRKALDWAFRVAFGLLILAILINLYGSTAHGHDAQHVTDWISEGHYISPTGGGVCCGLNDCGVLPDSADKPAIGGFAVHGFVQYFDPPKTVEPINEYCRRPRCSHRPTITIGAAEWARSDGAFLRRRISALYRPRDS
jgi:hypothetical protein